MIIIISKGDIRGPRWQKLRIIFTYERSGVYRDSLKTKLKMGVTRKGKEDRHK